MEDASDGERVRVDGVPEQLDTVVHDGVVVESQVAGQHCRRCEGRVE